MPDSGAFNVKVGGDFAFLAKKNFDGDYTVVNGSRTTVGTVVSITPASGKTFYEAGWKGITESGNQTATFQLQNNAVGIDDVFLSGGTGHQTLGIVKGDRLVSDGVLIYRVQLVATGDATTKRASLFGILIDTGVDPLL